MLSHQVDNVLTKIDPKQMLLDVAEQMDKDFDKWKAGIEKHELQGDHYWAIDGMKGEFGKSIDLDWIPRYIILDKTGKIALYKVIEADDEKLIKTLESLN